MRYTPTVKKILLSLVFLFSSIPLVSANEANQEAVMVKDNLQFIKLFTHEIQNRAFALKSVSRSVKAKSGEPDEQMWAAYFALEKLNQKKYQAVADKFGLSLEATCLTNIKTWSVGAFESLFPKTTLNVFKDATIAYVEELEKLEKLASSEDEMFFRYVVLQEEAQAQALIFLAEENPEQAAFILKAFVAKYDE